MAKDASDVWQVPCGDARAWVEQETSIHVKCVSSFGDPIELTAAQAESFGKWLIAAARRIDA